MAAKSKIWVVLQQREGQIARMSWEAIVAGQKLAVALGGQPEDVEAVLLGADLAGLAAEVARRRVGAVHVADAPALAAYTPGAYVAALAPAIRATAPDFVLFPHSYQSVDYVPRLAAEIDAGLLPEVTAFSNGPDGLLWKRPILGGKMQAQVRIQGSGTVLVSVQSGAFQVEAAGEESGEKTAAPIQALAVDLAAVRPDREVLGVEQVGGEKIDLTKAEIIVAVGRGVGGADKMGIVHELAQVLGAELGASRPVIDNGWLPRDRQIGSSGQTVAPKLYLAAGISGAIQHLVGMKGSTTIVAINKDPGAPIFTVADYGIVGDLHEVIPALTAAIRDAKA